MSQVKEYYKYLHTIPEEGFTEVKTAKFIADKLEEFGYEVTRNIGGKTGVMGIYNSGMPGPTVALRADMDALGHTINGVHCSRHSCGHDGHSSMLLATAEIFRKEKRLKRGKLKVLFQPAEELGTGALSMIEGGVIEDVDYLFGAHVRPLEEALDGQASPAIFYSAAARIIATFHGKPAHGARPHLGVNVIDAATAAVIAVNAIHLKPTENYSIKATRFLCDAGVTNAIPDEAVVTWDLRAQHNGTMKELKEKFFQAVTPAAATVGATVEYETPTGMIAAQLNEEATELLTSSIKEVLGESGCIAPIFTPGGEDFFFYTDHKPEIKAGFFGLGCDLKPGLHHPDMHFNVNALGNGVRIFLKLLDKLVG